MHMVHNNTNRKQTVSLSWLNFSLVKRIRHLFTHPSEVQGGMRPPPSNMIKFKKINLLKSCLFLRWSWNTLSMKGALTREDDWLTSWHSDSIRLRIDSLPRDSIIGWAFVHPSVWVLKESKVQSTCKQRHTGCSNNVFIIQFTVQCSKHVRVLCIVPNRCIIRPAQHN